MKKKIIELSDRRKQIICDSIKYACIRCPLMVKSNGICLKETNAKKEIKFYKKYIAELERMGNKEIETKRSKSR